MKTIEKWKKHILATLRTQGYPCELEMRANWGARAVQNRSRIRRWLRQHLLIDQRTVLDLASPPRLQTKTGGVAISHCLTLGGVVVNRGLRVGLDIETRRRIQPRIRDRIKHALDGSADFPPDLVWTIKEATFKMASPQIQMISEVALISLERQNRQTWNFQTNFSQGWVFRHSIWTLAVALERSPR